jgi:CheY-like chemotaxis protein
VTAPSSVRVGRVLVIDDEDRPALACLTSGEWFDVILCDIMMPGMSGIALHHHVERSAPDLATRCAR